MVSLRFLCVLFALSLVLGSAPGCKKESTPPKADVQTVAPPPVLKAAEQMTGAPAVLAALDKKDYEGAMAGLMEVAQSVKSDQDKVSFMVLKREMQMKLAGPAQTDPKAAQALGTLQLMTMGR